MAKSYESAGVSLEAGYEGVRRIKKHVAATNRKGSMGNIGSFGGMFDLASLGYKEPILVSGTDGVGTKLKLAFEMDKHDTIGIDAVAMCVNDVLAQGAEPLIFLDYVALGENIPEKLEMIVKGVSDGVYRAIASTGIQNDVKKIANKNGKVVFAPSEEAGRVMQQSVDMYNGTGGRY
jgi:phosphoribosylformylglycinamidine cyclo-ligase